MGASSSRAQLKVSVARFLELAYRKDQGITAYLVRDAGTARLSIDSRGNARLSGTTGVVTFSASDLVRQIGFSLRAVSVSFRSGNADDLRYTATYRFAGIASLSVSGGIDVEALITACSGWLCRAARALGRRREAIDRKIQREVLAP